jgi:hypothetical protein
VEADTVTEGTVTPTLLDALVCKPAFDTLAVRDGGGVVVTSTAVAESDTCWASAIDATTAEIEVVPVTAMDASAATSVSIDPVTAASL